MSLSWFILASKKVKRTIISKRYVNIKKLLFSFHSIAWSNFEIQQKKIDLSEWQVILVLRKLIFFFLWVIYHFVWLRETVLAVLCGWLGVNRISPNIDLLELWEIWNSIWKFFCSRNPRWHGALFFARFLRRLRIDFVYLIDILEFLAFWTDL